MKKSDVDDILEKWLAGEDVSEDDIWDEWELKYEDEDTYEKEDEDGLE